MDPFGELPTRSRSDGLPKSKPIYARIPTRLYDAVHEEAERRGHTLSRTVADLLTAAMASESLGDVLPAEVQSYLNGRRMFAMLSGLLEAAAEQKGEPDP